MLWIDIFTNLGFVGFYTLWALLAGGIAVFGVLSNFGKKGLIRDIMFSWIVGIVLVSISSTGALIFAAILRIFIIGLSRSIGLDNLAAMLTEDESRVKLKKPKTDVIMALVLILFFLNILAVIFAPPMEVGWYKMDDANIIEVSPETETGVQDIEWDHIKDMRLVSQEYALQIPKTMVTETGWKLSSDWDGIYPIDNTLNWVIVYEPTRLVNMGNPSPAYILVDAQNPSKRTKVESTIEYSEERKGLLPLAYQIIFSGKIRDVNINYWLSYPYFNFGDTVLTHDANDEPVWFAPVKLEMPTLFITKFYTEQVGIVALSNDGTKAFYSEDDIKSGNAPEWLLDSQALIDEDYTMKRTLIWARYASWKGFINYYLQHENVYEIAKEFYFQYDKEDDRLFGLIQLEPEGRTRKAITHYVDIEAEGTGYGTVNIYDTRAMGLIGPERALDGARGEISLYSDWYPLQPLFKKIDNGYFYVVPIYSGFYEAMVLKAVAVVDAKTEQVKLFQWHELDTDGAGISADSTDGKTQVDLGDAADMFSDCNIVSSKKEDGKLIMTIECV
ncbi:MAG: hypothetical protein GQ477_02350 [Nanohaloarchaea archaeon]|nr:hypothetical protein [Candidatus Nanohaloarchaea archaeon]